MAGLFRVFASVLVVGAVLVASGIGRLSAAEKVAAMDPTDCTRNPCPSKTASGVLGAFGPSAEVSSDSTSRFVALVINKSIALDLPRDVTDVLVGNTTVANAVLRSKRRAYIVGTGKGQTNVYFYDSKGQQIDGLNVNVDDHLISERIPEKEISVVSGGGESPPTTAFYECNPVCSPLENAKIPAPPPTFLVLPGLPSLPAKP
jgi:Pilus formation protein N terminal region